MENFFLLMNSVIDLWKIPSSMSTILDMTFAIICGVGLYYLLIPFLIECPESPPPRTEKKFPKVVKRTYKKARKKTNIKISRNSQQNAQDTQNASGNASGMPTESPTENPLLDSSPRSFWYSKEKLNQLSIFQLFSYLKVLEGLIERKFIQFLWGISYMFSESVVATASIFKKSPLIRKTVRFCDTVDVAQALPLAKEPPQLCQDQPLSYQLVTPNLVGVTKGQEQKNLPSSILNQRPSSSQSRAGRRASPNTEIGIQPSLPNGNVQHELNLENTTGCDIQKCQPAIGQPTDKLSTGALPIKAIRSASIIPEHYQMIHPHEGPQDEEKAISEGEQKGKHVRFCPSRKLPPLQEDFQPNNDGYCKNLPELSQPAQPSILNSRSYKSSQMAGYVPLGMILKKAIAKHGIPNTIKKDLSVRAKDLSCTLSSTPEKGLEPGNRPLRTEKLSSMKTTEGLSFLDPKTQMKQESNTIQHSEKHRISPCVSKAEYYSKAAIILEKMHHQDPGGTRVKTVSSASLQHPLFEHSPPEVQETQRAPPTAASHGPTRSHLDQGERYLSVQPNAVCMQAKPLQNRIIQGTGRCIMKQNTSPEISKHTPGTMSDGVIPGHPSWSAKSLGPEDSVRPSVAKQTTHALRSYQDQGERYLSVQPNAVCFQAKPQQNRTIQGTGRGIMKRNTSPEMSKHTSGTMSDNVVLGHPTWSAKNLGPEDSVPLSVAKQTSTLKVKSSTQPQSWPVSHHPNAPSTVHPAMVSLPSENSLPNFQNKWQKSSQGLGDDLMSSYQHVETKDFRVRKVKFKTQNVRQSILKSGDVNQGGRLGRVRPSILRSTKLKGTAKTESQSSCNTAGKREAPSQSCLKNITENATQYENLSTKYKGQGYSLKKERPLPVTEQTQEVINRVNTIYSTTVELRNLMNSLVQNLVNNVDEPSNLIIDPGTQVQGYKAESLAFQLAGSSHSSEGLHDQNHSRLARRMSSGHPSPKEHSHPFLNSGTGDKLQSGVDDQRASDQGRNKVKRGLGFNQPHTLTGNDHPCWGDGEKQKSGLADQRVSNLYKTKDGMGGFQYGRLEGQETSLKYKNRGVDQKAFHPYQNTKKGIGCGQSINPKKNYPVKNRGTGGKEQSAIAAQGASNLHEIRPKSPHRSLDMHNHSLRYIETEGKPQPSVNAQKACDQHLNSQKRMAFDNLLTANEKNLPFGHRVIGDKQKLGLADQRVSDPGQIRRSRMCPYPQRSPQRHNLSFRYRHGLGEVQSCVSAQRSCDQHPDNVKRRGFDHLPTPKGNNHPHSYKVIEDKQLSGLADQRACDPGQIIKKSGMGSCTYRWPEEYNFLVRYGIIGNKEQEGIVRRGCGALQNSKEGMGRRQPMSLQKNHPVKDRGIGRQEQSGVAAQRVSDRVDFTSKVQRARTSGHPEDDTSAQPLSSLIVSW
ncbi:uncharacterized protein LOC116088262 isoform X1 [Mastomys coucha]|uniref:uncharacterized protein LOC116088262 isoform X1 n=2 Tax=Mastomys coucha TaxID=35658 RepID=UPI001261C418|nr:uncharacterized protein LOC116088262 isoform X1 [Mastomys coucha]